MFYEATGKHNRVKLLYDPSHFILQQLDYLAYIDHYHEFFGMFHVKDAEFNMNGKSGFMEAIKTGLTDQVGLGLLVMGK